MTDEINRDRPRRVRKVAKTIVGHAAIRNAAINMAPTVGQAARTATYAAIARVGRAGTDTLIRGLAGAAKRSATLAAAGGGPLAKGGGGMARGEKVLGAVGIAGHVLSYTVAAASVVAEAMLQSEAEAAAKANPAGTDDHDLVAPAE